jgi:tripartite-type tricarboxylate transporter receptor subunit TctC
MKSSFHERFARRAALAAAAALFVAAEGGANAQDNFYSGKQITFVVPTTPGGGFDLYSRTFIEFMRRYIPGQPTVVVQNMPGAGGIRAANFMYTVAPRDGSTFGMPLSNVPFSEVIEPEAVKYRSAQFSWIGKITPETEVLAVWRNSGISNIEDTLRKEVVVGGTSRLGMPTLNAALTKALLGSRFKIILGYPAGIEAVLAMETGEVQGRFNEWTSWKSQRPKWIEDGLLNYLVQIGPKEKELPQVPSLLDLVNEPREKAMVELMQSNQFVGRSIYAPPAVPAERVATLRQAFDRTMRDPEFLARMKAQRLEVDAASGAALRREIERTMENADAAARDLKQRLDL